MLGRFNTPCVDNLREGIDYRVIDLDFAAPPVDHTPGQPCPPGHKMIWGMCRKLKSGSQDWDPGDESEMEKKGKARAKELGSTFETNKPVDVGGKRYGWAKKNGKDVLVEWGSVCAKRVNGKCVPAEGVTPAAPAAPVPSIPPPPTTSV